MMKNRCGFVFELTAVLLAVHFFDFVQIRRLELFTDVKTAPKAKFFV